MKKVLIAAVLILISGIITSCSKPASVTPVATHKGQVILTGDKKDLASAD